MRHKGSVLVTGATGFIGGALARRLHEEGHRVFALVRSGREDALPPTAEPVAWPNSQEALRAAVIRTRARSCVHLAARFAAEHQAHDVADLVQSNVGLTASVADACAHASVGRLVFSGTVWQHYAGPAYRPVSLYAATKQAACDVLRHFALNDGLAVDVLKLPDTYGFGDPRRKVVDVLLGAARTGETLSMSPGQQLVDLVHVDDVVAAIMALLIERHHESWREFALGSGNPITLRELAAVVARVTGTDLNVSWGGRPYRTREAFEPWQAGPPPAGWKPRITLEHGLEGLWRQRRCDG